MSIRICSIAVVCTLLVFCCSAAFGQATGSFSGTVVDKSGSAVAGATVTVTSESTGVARPTKTDEVGHYAVPFLPVGLYTVRVEFTGFQTVENKDLRLQVDEARELDFTLSPSTQSTSVEVSAEAVAVETTNPSLGQVITSQEVSQLPLNGRDFVQLATLTSGATSESNPNSFFTSGADSEVATRGSFSLSVGGSRPNSTDWLLDGVDNNELTAGGIGTFSSIDDIQEFKVLTYNYSAQYGTRAGPTVLVTTKSGGNSFHGSLFEFLRNTSLDAKSFFATSAEKFNLNQYGGSLGGPIRKGKTFFFVDGEQKDQRRGITFTGLVPSLAMRPSAAQPFADFTNDPFGNPVSGSVTVGANTVSVPAIVNPNMLGASTNPAVFPNVYFQCNGAGNPTAVNPNGSQVQGTPCAKIPAGLVNSIGGALISLYPTPNANNAASGINFVSEPVRRLDETKFDARVDHAFSANDNAFARFSYDDAVSFVPGGFTGGFAEASAFGSNQGIVNHARNIAIGETHVFSPTTVNQASFGYNRIFDYITSQGTGSCASAQLGIPGANLGCSGLGSGATCVKGAYSCGLVSTLMVGGFWSLGDRGFTPFQGGTNIFSFADSLDLIRGKHEFKVGLDVRANQMNVGTEAFQDGFWIPGAIGTFSGFSNAAASIPGNPEADLVLGLVGVSEHDQTFNGPVTGRRWKIWRPYVQDDWRITKNLTFNLGIAWDLTTPITESAGRLADYIPDSGSGTLLIANKGGVNASAGIQRSWTAFEPRIGFAYKLLGNDKTVIRGGYSIYHDSAWSQGAQGLWQNPPFFAEGDNFGLAENSGITFGPNSPVGCPSATSFCAGTNFNITGVTTTQGFPIFNTPPDIATFTGTFNFQPTNFKLGMVQQFNVNIEHQLPGNIVLTAGYAGARGRHILEFGDNLNTNSPLSGNGVGPTACGTVSGYTVGCTASGGIFTSPFGVGNSILEFGDLGKTTYNSLQIKAETKTARYGLYALVAYSYSKTYDNGLSDGLGSELSAPFFPLPNWETLDWSLSQINLNNSFTASVIYDLPFGRGKKFGSDWSNTTNTLLGGWQVTLIEKITSGFPVPLINSANASGVAFNAGGNGNNFNRPDEVAGCNPYAVLHSQLQWINPACFPAAPAGQLGNAPRVPVYGPDFVNSDFSLIKQFALPWENMGLNFRAEFFNLFNHAQFGLPVNDVNAIGFGSVNSTVNNPRLVQFGLKLTF